MIDFDGTLLFVSHDRYFINRVATHVLELSENGSTLYLGDYDYYVEKKAEVEMIQTEEISTTNQAKEASPVQPVIPSVCRHRWFPTFVQKWLDFDFLALQFQLLDFRFAA